MNRITYKKIFRDAMKERNISVGDVCEHFGKSLETIENWLCGISQPLKIVDRVAFCEYFGIEYVPGLFTYDTEDITDDRVSMNVNASIPKRYIKIVDLVRAQDTVSLEDFVEFLNFFDSTRSATDLNFDILHWCYEHVCWGTYTRIVAHIVCNDENFKEILM